MRINKYLSDCGFCSRREADRRIEAKEIVINGQIATLGSQVEEGDLVTCKGQIIKKETSYKLLAVNKPVGIVCTTTDKQGDNNIINFLNLSEYMYPVGRLDKDSSGLLLLTNNGQLMDNILRSSNNHEKEYIVKVDKPINREFIKKMSSGVKLKELNRVTNPCKVFKLDDYSFKIILTQGLNRQIRRMCQAFGREVISLKRVRIMNIMLGDLKEGACRPVTGKEYNELLKLCGMKLED
jgi:23S rRNA pseudouridine2604 synthase